MKAKYTYTNLTKSQERYLTELYGLVIGVMKERATYGPKYSHKFYVDEHQETYEIDKIEELISDTLEIEAYLKTDMDYFNNTLSKLYVYLIKKYKT